VWRNSDSNVLRWVHCVTMGDTHSPVTDSVQLTDLTVGSSGGAVTGAPITNIVQGGNILFSGGKSGGFLCYEAASEAITNTAIPCYPNSYAGNSVGEETGVQVARSIPSR
jgi:hypothetical protein